MYSTGNSTQYFVITYKGKESEKKTDIYVCITESLCCTPETNTSYINYTSIKKKKFLNLITQMLLPAPLSLSPRVSLSEPSTGPQCSAHSTPSTRTQPAPSQPDPYPSYFCKGLSGLLCPLLRVFLASAVPLTFEFLSV